jgi:hypothetical protein
MVFLDILKLPFFIKTDITEDRRCFVYYLFI